MAQHNWALYPKVEIRNIAWEDAQIGNEGFDVVLAANSFHWIPFDTSYQNAAIALRRNGYLILLWNMQHQPQFEVFEKLMPVYESHTPELVQFEDRNDQEQIALEFGREVSGSGLFCLLGCKSWK
jgi:SAM-dependent methyltransferase